MDKEEVDLIIAEQNKSTKDILKAVEEMRVNCQDLLSSKDERIKDLEKENAELKKEVEKHKWNNIFLEDCAVYDKKITEEYTTLQEHIEQLEKENTELKEKYVKNICDCDICDTYCNSQLIKAKEIIKTFLGFAEAFGYSPSMDKFIAEAEQFLSEVEK